MNTERRNETARLWYNEDETRKEGKFMLRLTGEYIAQDTFSELLNQGWEPVRADDMDVMGEFWRWIENRHKHDIPDRDQLRREWFDFTKEKGVKP